MKIYWGWWIVLICLLAQIVGSGSAGYVFSTLVVPMEQDLGWNRATIYLALSLGTVTGNLISPILGPLFDKYGARVMMALSAGFGGICAAAVGGIAHPWQYFALLGLGVAITRPALQILGPRTVAANWFLRKRPTAFALLTSGTPISGIVLVPIAVWMIVSLGWRSVWIAMGLLEACLIAPLAWLVIRRHPEELGLRPDGAAAPAAAESAFEASEQRRDDSWTPKLALKTKAFWLLILGFLLISFPSSTVLVHLVPFWLDKGLSQAEATGLFSLYAFVALMGRPLWAMLVTKFGVHRCLIAFAVCYSASMVLLTFTSGLVWVAFAAFWQAVIIGGYGQLQAQVLPDYFGRRYVGTLTGYSSFLILPAMASSPFITALLHDARKSYFIPFSAYSISAMLAIICFFFAWRPTTPGETAKTSTATLQ